MSLVSLVSFKLLDDTTKSLKEEYDAVNFLQWHHQTFHNASGSSVDIPTAYSSFKAFCNNAGHQTPSWQEFSKLMAKHSKKQRTPEGRMQFTGIGINNHFLNKKEDLDESWELHQKEPIKRTFNEAKQKWDRILDNIPTDPKEVKRKQVLAHSFISTKIKNEEIEEQELCEGLVQVLKKTVRTGKSLRDRYLARKNKVFHTVFYRHGGYDDGESFNSGEWFIHSHHENSSHAKTASDFLKQFDVEKVRTLPLNKEQLRSAYSSPHEFMASLEGQLGHQKKKREVVKLNASDSFKEWHRINKDKLEATTVNTGKYNDYVNWAKKHEHEHIKSLGEFENHLDSVGLKIKGISKEELNKLTGKGLEYNKDITLPAWYNKKNK